MTSSDDTLPSQGLLMELDEAVRSKLLAAGRYETRAAGEVIATQGKPHYAMIAIMSGKLSVSCHSQEDRVELEELGPGDIAGEMSVLDDPHVASADVRVVDQPARLWILDGDAFEKFLQSDPVLGLAIMRLLARELCRVIRHNSVSMLRQAEALRYHYQDMDY